MLVDNRKHIVDDDPSRRTVTEDKGKFYAKSFEAEYIETSAKTGHNVDELFQTFIRYVPTVCLSLRLSVRLWPLSCESVPALSSLNLFFSVFRRVREARGLGPFKGSQPVDSNSFIYNGMHTHKCTATQTQHRANTHTHTDGQTDGQTD